MRIYIFKSEAKNELRAFAGDPAGSKLPQKHGPWTATGVIRADKVDQAVGALHGAFELGASEIRQERPIGQEAR